MNVFRPIGIAGLAWRDAARGLGRGRVWWPVGALVVVQFALLVLLVGFTAPWSAPVALPLVRLLGGEVATHYPAHLYLLPGMFEQATLVARALALPIVAAMLSLRFAELFGAVARDATPRLRGGSIVPLVSVGLMLLALPLATGWLYEEVIARIVPPLAGAEHRVTDVSVVLALTALVHTIPSIALRGHGLLAGLRDGLRRTSTFLVPTLLVVALPLAILHPVVVSLPAADLGAAALRPELTIVLVGARIVLEAVLLVLAIGAVTRLYVSRRGDRR